MNFYRRVRLETVLAISLLSMAGAIAASAQEHAVVLEFIPASTTVEFTVDDPLHTVHGAFNLKHGQVHYDLTSGAVTGDIVVDATSGHSGSNARDGRMHREILESAQYPEIAFRPDRVEGKLSAPGSSTLQVHGLFSIHGAEHEITVPVQVEFAEGHWTATAHFDIPYVKWGIKNPSNFFLHVGQSVAIEIHASGANPENAGGHN